MDDDRSTQLAELDEEITRIRGDVDGMTDQLSGQGSGALDSEDRAAALNNLEESRALLENLEARRLRLVDGPAAD